MRTRTLMLATFLVMASGCGYTLATGTSLPSDVRVVHVAPVQSADLDPVFADRLARELRRTLRTGGILRPAADGEAADAVLRVRLDAERVRAVAFDEFDDVLDYTSSVAVAATLHARDGRLLWSRERIAATRGHAAVGGAVVTSSAAFQVGERLERAAIDEFDNVQLGEERKAAARERIAVDLAEQIYTSMTEGF